MREVVGVSVRQMDGSDGEFILCALLRFANGTLAELNMIAASTLLDSTPVLHIIGASGEIAVTTSSDEGSVRVVAGPLGPENRLLLPDSGFTKSYKPQLSAFYNWYATIV